MLSSRPLTVIVLGLTLLAGGCDRQSKDKAQPQPSGASSAAALPPGAIDRAHKGEPIPSMRLADESGKKVALNDPTLRGKPLLINLWATWCAPCVAELPQLDRLAAQGRVRVLLVSQDMDGPGHVRAYFAKGKMKQLEGSLLDPANDLSARYAVTTLPSSIFYGADGKELWRVTGPRDWSSPDTAKLLAEGG